MTAGLELPVVDWQLIDRTVRAWRAHAGGLKIEGVHPHVVDCIVERIAGHLADCLRFADDALARRMQRILENLDVGEDLIADHLAPNVAGPFMLDMNVTALGLLGEAVKQRTRYFAMLVAKMPEMVQTIMVYASAGFNVAATALWTAAEIGLTNLGGGAEVLECCDVVQYWDSHADDIRGDYERQRAALSEVLAAPAGDEACSNIAVTDAAAPGPSPFDSAGACCYYSIGDDDDSVWSHGLAEGSAEVGGDVVAGSTCNETVQMQILQMQLDCWIGIEMARDLGDDCRQDVGEAKPLSFWGFADEDEIDAVIDTFLASCSGIDGKLVVEKSAWSEGQTAGAADADGDAAAGGAVPGVCTRTKQRQLLQMQLDELWVPRIPKDPG